MIRMDADHAAAHPNRLRRRDLLRAGSLTSVGLGVGQAFGLNAAGFGGGSQERSCILLMLVGGPSQLDTWDMKPSAPAEIRGPYKPIRTNVSGIEISEIFPRMARHADKYAILRGMYHTAAAVHDTGHQLMQTGRLFQAGMEHPHMGCVAGMVKGARAGAPPHVVLPHPIGNTGGSLPHGQDAGYLGKAFDPFLLTGDPASPDFRAPHLPPTTYLASLRSEAHAASSHQAREAFELHREPEAVRQKYGMNRFGQSCLLARRLVESGVRFVTVNMFETVFDEITWDIHGSSPFSPMSCYRDHVGPMFDMAYSALLQELSERGLLGNTMVVAGGEFGRTPKINPSGGRDHWPQVWSMLMAGGGVRGGQVIGSSDAHGAAPKDRPTTPAEVAATIYHSLGIPLDTELPVAEGQTLPVVDRGVQPIHQLFA